MAQMVAKFVLWPKNMQMVIIHSILMGVCLGSCRAVELRMAEWHDEKVGDEWGIRTCGKECCTKLKGNWHDIQ